MRMVGQNGGKFERLIKFIKNSCLIQIENFFHWSSKGDV